ncbi:transcription termination factor NusA [Iamia sp.]|uniref:transcription termination factor NusA n=1 Tax=Iamia sp. TaxID=2722710 RepID=UPI002C65A9F8|nr:transcription termination factor NusA [Iamia sp.]HXH59046.1 transcription termination factor NusA [Iamia sp.]
MTRKLDMMEALQALAADRGISSETLMGALADAMESAYSRIPGAKDYAWVTIDPDTFDILVWSQEIDEDGEPYGDVTDVTPPDFGRIAAQTARQVMNQRLREVDREMKYEEYSGREGDIVTGIIQQGDSRYTLLELNRGVEALLPQAEQVPHERPQANARLKAYIVEVRKTVKGPQIVVSRTHPGLIRRLFEMEVPEIAEGIVELKACAREPGHRTKIAVWSNDTNVDPVGACVGARGARVRMVVNELNGEKIDIVPFTDVPEDLVAKALAPAKVKEVRLDYDTGTATVIVPDFQLSLAIGKEGQNARLAARLSGWRVDIKSETQLAEEEAYANQDWAEGEWITDTATGEQLWQPADGSDALSALAWATATEQNEADAATTDASPTSDADAPPVADRTLATDAATVPDVADEDAAISIDPESSGDESAVSTEAVAADEVAGAADPTPAGVDAASGATPEAEIAAGAMPEDQ